MLEMVKTYCLRDCLETFDPYDIWKTELGFSVKKLYNEKPMFGLAPAAILTVADCFFNSILRTQYLKQDYPVVRAFAALALLNIYEETKDAELLIFARYHLDWLASNSSTGYCGFCWGIGFDYPVAAGLVYDKNTPFTTNTPYPLEAFIRYREITGSKEFDKIISSVYDFFEHDIPVLKEDEEICITAYGPRRDRIVTNAVSYTMYAYAMLLNFVPENQQSHVRQRVEKLYRFILRSQRRDGSWLYSPEEGSFVDCFHTCFILKNIVKTDRLIPLENAEQIVGKGFSYLVENMFDSKENLFRRFSVKNKPGLVKFDLYDNAEAYSLSLLLDKTELSGTLSKSIYDRFVRGNAIYSQIDIFGICRQKNTLRWAVMPYLLAISEDSRCKN